MPAAVLTDGSEDDYVIILHLILHRSLLEFRKQRLEIRSTRLTAGAFTDVQTSNMHAVASRPPAENARRITNEGLRIIGVEPKSATLVSDFLMLYDVRERS